MYNVTRQSDHLANILEQISLVCPDAVEFIFAACISFTVFFFLWLDAVDFLFSACIGFTVSFFLWLDAVGFLFAGCVDFTVSLFLSFYYRLAFLFSGVRWTRSYGRYQPMYFTSDRTMTLTTTS